MLNKVIPFTSLVSQGRWKVEFFCAEGIGARPQAYNVVRLAEVFTERRESLDPQQFPDHTFNYLGLEHIQSLTGDITGFMPRLGKAVLSRSKIFRGGDILYARLRPSLNKVFVADDLLPEGICSGEFHVLIPNHQRIRPQFGRAMLASSYVQDAVAGMTTGSALPRLQLDDLLIIEIPLPPLKEQDEIERTLSIQRDRRVKLARELSSAPSAALESLVAALEEGVPYVPPKLEHVMPSYALNKLPSDLPTGVRKRGRPRQSTFEFT